MSLETFKSILTKFQNEKNIDLNLFGWEPLLNREIIDYITGSDFEWIEAISIISINTNGVFLSSRFIDFASQYKDKVRIDLSLDGNKEIHDYYRKDVEGKWSYDIILKNIENIQDFSNYNINFCVAPFASNKLFAWVENLVKLGFRNIKLMFLYEKNWSYDDFKKLCSELMRLRSYKWNININIFHPYIEWDQECRNDFLESFTFLPSGEVIPCPVWISKKSSQVINIQPFTIKKLEDKKEIIEEKVFWNKELSSIIEAWAICESIQWIGFTRNKKIIESLLSKIYHYE